MNIDLTSTINEMAEKIKNLEEKIKLNDNNDSEEKSDENSEETLKESSEGTEGEVSKESSEDISEETSEEKSEEVLEEKPEELSEETEPEVQEEESKEEENSEKESSEEESKEEESEESKSSEVDEEVKGEESGETEEAPIDNSETEEVEFDENSDEDEADEEVELAESEKIFEELLRQGRTTPAEKELLLPLLASNTTVELSDGRKVNLHKAMKQYLKSRSPIFSLEEYGTIEGHSKEEIPQEVKEEMDKMGFDEDVQQEAYIEFKKQKEEKGKTEKESTPF